ncbi:MULTISPECIES: hypothetical protein [Corynebacterium]|nr:MULTISPECIES: hypothetical protein [Corynebacterium]
MARTRRPAPGYDSEGNEAERPELEDDSWKFPEGFVLDRGDRG